MKKFVNISNAKNANGKSETDLPSSIAAISSIIDPSSVSVERKNCRQKLPTTLTESMDELVGTNDDSVLAKPGEAKHGRLVKGRTVIAANNY